jgi:hypothetical protein
MKINDEARMTNVEGMRNEEARIMARAQAFRPSSFDIVSSFVVRHSSLAPFVIRHSSFSS